MGMAYQRYAYDGQGVVTIMFNLDYETAENYQILLCKMAFTNTLCQVEGVGGQNFDKNIAVRSPIGTPITIAPAVT